MKYAKRALAGFLTLVALAGAGGATATLRTTAPPWRKIAFPVKEQVTYTDTFGAPRVGHTHQGQDLIGKRLFHELAAASGTVTWMRNDAAGTGGNWLEITDSQGWLYEYGHINNDTPGTDDGLNPAQWRFAPGLQIGSTVKKGQFVAYMGDSGDAEFSVPHLHFEIRMPDRTPINPWASLRIAQNLPVDDNWCGAPLNPPNTPTPQSARGYWIVDAKGALQAFGSAIDYGDAQKLKLWAPVLGVESTLDGLGYRLIARDGGVFSYGDARFYGSTGGMKLWAPVAGLVPTASGKGYWLFAQDGGIFSFGDAHFYGSASAKLHASAAATAMAVTPSGKGYWIVASDGAVFAFGDAPSLTASASAQAPITGIASTPSGLGYWLVSQTGEVLAAGDAGKFGSPIKAGPCQTSDSVALRASHTGQGYWVLHADGSIDAFGDALGYGDAAGAMAAAGFAVLPF